jgi:serine/threonine protein kinase
MNAESDKLSATFADQLSSFDDKLASKADDLELLAEIRDGIGRLLEASGGSEAEIRRVLQEQYENGGLRKETFQLVKSMLDRYVTEQVPTSTGSQPKIVTPATTNAASEPANDDPFSSTDVIATDVLQAEDAEARVQVGSVLRDRFMLQERLAGGSMGVVYKAMDRRLAEAGSQNPWVAIKVLSPQLARNGNALRALQQEAAKSRCLTHPNIVSFIDFDRDDDLYFMIMEWLEGRTLAHILDSPDGKTIDFEKAFSIVRQVGKALEYAHRCGIVHADVKPGNIMMTAGGDAKLFDFGVARVQQRQHADDNEFDPGVLGAVTPAYSSMQVLTGDDPVPADDVFSLACLLYRLLAGYRVFGPRNAAEAAEAGMTPQRLAGLSDEQWSAIKKALSFSRITRFETMSGFLEALNSQPGNPAGLDVVGHHVEFEDSSGSLRWVFALVALLMLLGFAGYQFGIVDEVLRRLDLPESGMQTLPPVVDEEMPAVGDEPEVVPATDMQDVPVDEAESSPPDTEATADVTSPTEPAKTALPGPEPVLETLVDDLPTDATPVVDDPVAEPGIAPEPEPQIVDFSRLPLPDVEIPIAPNSFEVELKSVTLREDSRPVIVDFVRPAPLDFPMTLRLEEVGFSGNRSPWNAGQFTISDNGIVKFPAGQERARITLSMASDPLREADQQSTLRVREADTAAVELATIEVVLEDDDQRRFEAGLPANTIAFAASQVSVQERDPAVQIDFVRFNPDETSIVVNFEVFDVTATAGEDYFSPGNNSVSFGPGQRAARILIPLVQDSTFEGDEAFVVDLESTGSAPQNDVYYRVAIMIRDDDGS